MNAKELAAEYDRLYAEAEAVLNEFKPCEHTFDLGNHHCIGQGEGVQTPYDYGSSSNIGPQCCCNGCKSWTDKGCVADKPLGCKTWLCGIARIAHPEACAKLDTIARQAMKLNIYFYRAGKDASLRAAREGANTAQFYPKGA